MTRATVTPTQASLSNARLPFEEQLAAIRERTRHLIPTERWTDLMRNGHDRGFVVAGAMKADLLAEFARAIDRVAAEGKSIEWFRENFDAIVERHGWAYRGSRNWRTRVIYTTNLRTSYAAGRLAQLRDPALREAAPYWMYRHGASAEPREQHLAWDRLTLPADDPWFQTHYPPNGWGCSCYVVAVSEATARRQGGRFERPGPDPKGAIDPGWDYMPGDTVADELRRTVEKKTTDLPPPLGQSFDAAVAAAAARRRLFEGEGFLGQRPGLFDLPPVIVTELTGREFGAGLSHREYMQRANDFLRALQGIALYNDDTGWGFEVNRAGRKKMGSNLEQTDDELRAVAGLESLVRRAIVGERHPDSGHANPDVRAILRLYAPLALAGELYRVKLTGKEFLDGRRVLHALEIESALPGTLPSYSGPEGLQTAQPTTGRTISIRDLLRSATRADGTEFAP